MRSAKDNARPSCSLNVVVTFNNNVDPKNRPENVIEKRPGNCKGVPGPNEMVDDGERYANKDEEGEERWDGERRTEDELDGSQDAFDSADAIRNVEFAIDGDLVVALRLLNFVFGDWLCLDQRL